ncbi:MAG: SCO family protein [Alphaproteobacteria bacterium]
MEQDKHHPDPPAPGEHDPQEEASGRPAWRPRPLTLVFAGVTLLLAAILGVMLLTTDAPVSGTAPGTGTAKVGGPFELVDHTGRTVTQADFAGKPMLIYFGFTYCPDVCPTALQVMSQALDRLGPQAEQVQPVFISIDPERDTPENMAAYVGHFHERMVGLTGTPEQVRQAADAYRVYYKKSKGAAEADYLMDHSSVVYLMGPEGEFLAHFNHTTSPEKMAEGIAKALKNSR